MNPKDREDSEKPAKVVVSVGENRGYSGKSSRMSFYVSPLNTGAAEELAKEMREKLDHNKQQEQKVI